MGYEVKDSGKRESFDTGAVRDIQENKGRFDLIPPEPTWALAIHFEKGAVKYGDNNWAKGINLKRYLSSARRHLVEYEMGLTDENHLIAALWNIYCMYATHIRIDNGELPESLNDMQYPIRLPELPKNRDKFIK